MKYYQRLKALREDRDLTQQNIAEVLFVKQTAISSYELGLRALPIDTLETLCKFYRVSADYILGLPKDLDYPER
ncbi:MAG: helix-turn-helix domain-containing protein [Eubacterium sp.]|nr:helix-turn-helix domain-containing protein [Eubacterium sp.]